jgi:hypothetical protein
MVFISLCLAFWTDGRLFVLLFMRKLFQVSFWAKVWKNKFHFNEYDGIIGSIEKERRRRATSYGYKKWKVGS